MTAFSRILARSNVEQLSHAQLARQQAAGEGEGARVFGLDRTRLLLRELGNPQERYRIVHVAGSKGKGSVCEMIASGLTHAGVCCGLFTSPHVMHLRERVRVAGRAASDEQLEELAQLVLDAEHRSAHERDRAGLGDATHFEMLVAIALLHFARQAVDVAVVEVGLGGLLDATNVVSPGAGGVCVLTSIQREHADLLGDTLAAIATHKAGIMKASAVTLSAPQEPSVLEVFRKQARAVSAVLLVLGEGIPWHHREGTTRDSEGHSRRSPRVWLSHAGTTIEGVHSPLPGEHNAENTALALAACAQLRHTGLVFDMYLCERGVEKTTTQGRLEVVCATHPRVIVDGAHTPDSIRAVLASLPAFAAFDSLVVVFGCASDKDAVGIGKELALAADKVIVTQAANSARAASTAVLQRAFVDAGVRAVSAAATLAEAIARARAAATARDVILVIGSFALAGEAKRLLATHERENSKE